MQQPGLYPYVAAVVQAVQTRQIEHYKHDREMGAQATGMETSTHLSAC